MTFRCTDYTLHRLDYFENLRAVGLSTAAIYNVYSFGNFRDQANVIIQAMQPLVGFSVIPKAA